MTDDVQPLEPPAELLRVARDVTPGWMRRSVVAALRAGDEDPPRRDTELEALVADWSDRLLGRLADLLATDVDEQRTTPLSVYREAVREPTAWLRSTGVGPPPPDPAAPSPGDPYRLGPATWSDIDPALHEPGLTWGAWKAMIVLRRRREEGRR